MSGQNISGVYLQTDTGSGIQVILRDGDGMERLLPPVTPAEDLVRAVGGTTRVTVGQSDSFQIGIHFLPNAWTSQRKIY